LNIDANRWTREGILKVGAYVTGRWAWTYSSGSRFSVTYQVFTDSAYESHLRLFYTWTWNGSGEPQSADYAVQLARTVPRFGGLRWWFICPLTADGRLCGRRVGKLYLPPRASYFGCRHCYDLSYTSRQQSRQFDAVYRGLAASTGMDVKTVKSAMRTIEKGR
jgi:hypothetical protein